MKSNGLRALLISVGLSAPLAGFAADGDEVLVLTALPVTYSVTKALAIETGIVVQNVPERGRRLNTLENFFQTRANRFGDLFSEADAVVTIGKLWRDDPLFTAVRAANIRIVDIDATKPWSTTLEGVSVAFEPEQDARWSRLQTEERDPSIYFWLSPANGARMADIIARDLARLAPLDGERIGENLAHYRRQLLELKREYEVKLAVLPDVTVFALTPEFIYLTTDMGLYVDGYFFKQDIDWAADDLENLESYLSDNDIGVVIHKWEPSDEIQAAIAAAGASLVVLDTIDAGIVEEGVLVVDSYSQLMRANLEGLYQALRAAN